MYVLGVDLGTTATAAAVCRSDSPQVLELGTARAAIPSVVAVDENGGVLTGEAAERRAFADPARAAREFKRRLGDTTPILVGRIPFSAQELSAKLLEAVVDFATSQEGSTPTHVVITHPATYGQYKLDTLTEAAGLAEVGEWSFLSEPEAAAEQYAEKHPVGEGEHLAVYDFGGGTFDATVIRRSEDGFKVVGEPGGIAQLGGVDLDAAVLGFVREHLDEAASAASGSDPDTMAAWLAIKDACRGAKEALSEDSEAVLPITLPGHATQRIRLLRSEFEAMAEPKINETVDAMRRVVESAHLTFDELARILLVGGSSRIPLVADVVVRRTGCEVHVDAHPKHAVALGAALHGCRRLDDQAGGDKTERWSEIRRLVEAEDNPS